ncbi:N-acetylmuramoyl-L-alanine amidase [Streptomyces sp. RS10V-4]|uniref:N-acetylmuramoyl-L-alanine amidase n=1 Tax=Streptomyces rhizoryzae TaxID=2932493 RepID=UPI002002AB5B|nr:N-acetylmuramoyl-L-alanine amidase [Streptomyces rhizoryzae]MCK7623446.1 N-acetylmuramoyl-L-alanine amidase [Streptomyces rhizoryzae]
MSNGSTFPAYRRRPRGALLIALAVLVAAGAGGWLLWRSPGGGPAAPGAAAPASPAPGASSPGGADPAPPATRPAGPGSLHGRTVLLDPGHNPHNIDHTRQIARLVDIGNDRKECDTTGTSTDGGYPEAAFTLDVVRRARALLEAEGARVVLTQDGDRPYGPCVDERAAAGNAAHADAAVSVHADGSAPGNRGFHVILPDRVTAGAADTAPITGPSRELGERLAGDFAAATGSARSNYLGHGTGLDVRADLGGLNLSTVPKVFIECGNMRDPKDAAQLTDAQWREKAARGITEGITDFLTR